MKKSKKRIEQQERIRHKTKAMELTLNENYKADLDKYNKTEGMLPKVLRKGYIEHIYSIAEPYDMTTLESVKNGNELLMQEIYRVVDYVEPEEPRKKGYIYLKIKKNEPKERILHMLNLILDIEQKEIPKGKRFREEKLKALELFKRHLSAKTKSLSCIAHELGMSYATARSRWMNAYSLIYGKRYIPQEVKSNLKAKADRLCAECKAPKCYEVKKDWMEQIPCADFIALAGKGYQREKTLSKKQGNLTHSGEIID